jgi:hypothetical protein
MYTKSMPRAWVQRFHPAVCGQSLHQVVLDPPGLEGRPPLLEMALDIGLALIRAGYDVVGGAVDVKGLEVPFGPEDHVPPGRPESPRDRLWESDEGSTLGESAVISER